MSSRSPSLLTIVRLCLVPETKPSSCGILWLSANTPSRMMDTLTGCPVSAFLLTMPTQSLFHVDGTVQSRCINFRVDGVDYNNIKNVL